MRFTKYLSRSALAFGVLASFAAVTPTMASDVNNRGVPAVSTGVGPQSTAGDRAACINGTGPTPSIAFSKGATDLLRTAVGTYIVRFNRDVTNCVRTATIGLCGNVNVSPPGEITTVRSFEFADGVFVTTHNSAGARRNRSFQLLVTCE